MSAEEYEALEAVYPQVIASMPETFDGHEFILKLAHEHQRLYVLALAQHVSGGQPFKDVHGQIASRLHNFPSLVTKTGTHNSEDIFRQVNSTVTWQKVRG